MSGKKFENLYSLRLMTEGRNCQALIDFLKDQDSVISIKHIPGRFESTDTIILTTSGLAVIDTIYGWFESAKSKDKQSNTRLKVESQEFVIGKESCREIKQKLAETRNKAGWDNFFVKERSYISNLIHKICRKYHFDRELEADVLQKVYLKAIRFGTCSENNLSARSFIRRVIHSVVTDELRSNMRKRKMFAAGESSSIEKAVEPDFAYLNPEVDGTMVDPYAKANQIVKVAKEVLSEKEQKIFFSIVVDGLSGKEVAKREQLPLGSIFTTLERAKRKIKKRLSKWSGFKFFVTF